MQSVAILTTSWNNRDKILSVLESCFIQIEEMKNEDKFSFSVYLLDDESTDGTYDAVSEKFPTVRITRTDAKGEWHHGVRLIWDIAASDNPDFYLMIDPHINLCDQALHTLLNNSKFLKDKAIIVGTIADAQGSSNLFGGMGKHGRLIEPDSILPVPCSLFDGLLVLIPKYVYQTIGNLDPAFKIKYADNDYSVRARKNGITIVTAPGILAHYDHKDSVPVWRNSAYPLKSRYKAMNSSDGCPPKERFLYELRKCGLIGAIGNNISIWIKVLFPKRRTNK